MLVLQTKTKKTKKQKKKRKKEKEKRVLKKREQCVGQYLFFNDLVPKEIIPPPPHTQDLPLFISLSRENVTVVESSQESRHGKAGTSVWVRVWIGSIEFVGIAGLS